MFGVLQGLGVSVNKIHQLAMANRLGRKGYREVAASGWYRMIARGLTFGYFTLSLFWFRGSWKTIGMVFDVLGSTGLLLAIVTMVAGAGLVLTVAEGARARLTGITVIRSRYVRTAWTTMLAVSAVTVVT